MGEELCTSCKKFNTLNDDGFPACYDCINFSSSRYIDTVTEAIENGTIDVESDIIREFRQKCPSGKCLNTTREQLSLTDKLALFLVEKVAGTMVFFFICIVLATIPLVWAKLMPLVSYISSGYLQLIYLPLILVSGTIASKVSDIRSIRDFKAQIKSMIELERLNYKIYKLEKKIDKFLTKASS